MKLIKSSLLILLSPTAWLTPHAQAHLGHHGELSPAQTMLSAHLKYDNEVAIKKNGKYLSLTSNGIPAHSAGRFPNPGNPNTISPQKHHFNIPVSPSDTGKFMRKEGVVGVALNGIPFEPGTAETWRGDVRWREEAIVNGKGRLGLDKNNAHVQPTGSYHYHGVPWGLIKNLQKKTKTSPDQPLFVGWAADGYPIYYQKKLQPSYQLKSGTRPDGSNGPGGRYDGTYTADFIFQAGSGDLDEANGIFSPTPNHPEGEYHYFVTEAFPYLPRVLKGVPDPTFKFPGGRPGMRPGGQNMPGGHIMRPPPGGNHPPPPFGPPPPRDQT